MIVQHTNGNSYLFINNRVFVSTYNETTNTVLTVELDLSLPLTDWEKEQIKLNIGDIIPDGYIYKVAVHSYGSHYLTSSDSLKQAVDLANEYNEDNGFANIITNNPNVDIHPLNGGIVYYSQEIDKLVYPYYYEELEGKVLVNSYSDMSSPSYSMEEIEDMQNESELNSLEGESPEGY